MIAMSSETIHARHGFGFSSTRHLSETERCGGFAGTGSCRLGRREGMVL
jgi:hypothetical protein